MLTMENTKLSNREKFLIILGLSFFALLIGLIFGILSSYSYLYFFDSFSRSPIFNTNISTNNFLINLNLNEKDTEKTMGLINNLDPLFLENLKSINVFYDVVKNCEEVFGEQTCGKVSKSYSGMSYRGKILVQFSDIKPCKNVFKYTGNVFDGECTKLTLCHEILHLNYPYSGSWNNPSHKKIMKLAEKEVCYGSA